MKIKKKEVGIIFEQIFEIFFVNQRIGIRENHLDTFGQTLVQASRCASVVEVSKKIFHQFQKPFLENEFMQQLVTAICSTKGIKLVAYSIRT